jgi:hypothetical protein
MIGLPEATWNKENNKEEDDKSHLHSGSHSIQVENLDKEDVSTNYAYRMVKRSKDHENTPPLPDSFILYYPLVRSS